MLDVTGDTTTAIRAVKWQSHKGSCETVSVCTSCIEGFRRGLLLPPRCSMAFGWSLLLPVRVIHQMYARSEKGFYVYNEGIYVYSYSPLR
jgi:hypothetical protein